LPQKNTNKLTKHFPLIGASTDFAGQIIHLSELLPVSLKEGHMF